MPPAKSHNWSRFELHTMLCLIAKGVHLEERVRRSDAPGTARVNAYENFATQLNVALHRNDYKSDISKREITYMLDHLLAEYKHVVGKGGLVERNAGGRITRAMRMSFARPARGFSGSQTEWENGRRYEVMTPYLIKMGKLNPKDPMAVERRVVEMSLLSAVKLSQFATRKPAARRIQAEAAAASLETEALSSGNMFINSTQDTFANASAKSRVSKNLDWNEPIQRHLARSGRSTNAEVSDANGQVNGGSSQAHEAGSMVIDDDLGRRQQNYADNIGNEVDMFLDTLGDSMLVDSVDPPRGRSRRRQNYTDNIGNDGNDSEMSDAPAEVSPAAFTAFSTDLFGNGLSR
ncbi:uncharacterized protein LY89DRAFT_475423 [Mollisia scopiformis]|uniref:Uncharacterized protein n=1 Tax=Mollisia scopiformis TaxID=149040 RepID=A0A194XFY3_MOLSC|nr:uncharacterized protein LY89DRAFT_475423 [Mollisia scopiformis]KUJ19051.1 hypothetical protein LY89DRAFT_475423 [Mollisia scopiformis]